MELAKPVIAGALALFCAVACTSPSRERAVAQQLLEEPWVEAATPRFTLLGNVPSAEIAALARQLELFRQLVLRATNVRDVEPRLPLRIYVLASTTEYLQLAPYGSAGVIYPTLRANLIVIDSEDEIAARAILYHEYVHFLLRNRGRVFYPMWYDEGLAELYSSVGLDGDFVVVGRVPEHRKETLRSHRIPLRRLLIAGDTSAWWYRDSAALYAQAWALVHYLHYGHRVTGGTNRLPQLVRYLALRNRGVSEAEAFDQAFDASPMAVERELEAYLAGGRFALQRFPVASFSGVREPELRSVPRSESGLDLAAAALARGNGALAAELVSPVLEEHPGHPQARSLRARSWALQDRHEEALALGREAVASAPGDPTVRVDLARVLLHPIQQAAAKAESEGEMAATNTPPAALREARQQLEMAIELDPRLPEAHALLGETYVYDEGDPTPGVAALERALEMVPWNPWVSMQLGALYLRTGESDRARELLGNVIRWTHDADMAGRARELLEELEGGGS